MADRPAAKSRNKPGRKRLLAGWLMLTFGVLVTYVWGASGWKQYSWAGDDWSGSIFQGELQIQRWTLKLFGPPLPDRHGYIGELPYWTMVLVDDKVLWTGIRREQSWNLWLVSYDRSLTTLLGTVRTVRMVFWPVSLLSLSVSGLLFRSTYKSRRRAMTGVGGCLNCGYDLRGLAATAPCPECGFAPSARRAQRL